MSVVPAPPKGKKGKKESNDPQMPDATSKEPLGAASVPIQFRVPDSVRQDFRLEAVASKMSMSELFLHIYGLYKKQEKKRKN